MNRIQIIVFLGLCFNVLFTNAAVASCSATRNHYGYSIQVSESYVNKFGDRNKAKQHCWERLSQSQTINYDLIDCHAEKDAKTGIRSIMSGRFINIHDSYEKAIQGCWSIYGFNDDINSFEKMPEGQQMYDSPLDGGALLRDWSYFLHKSNVKNYYEAQEKEQQWRETKYQNVILDDDPIVCTAEFITGLYVTVKDAVTDSNIACLANVQLEENHYKEVLDNIDCLGGRLHGLGERPGTYSLIATAPGYKDFISEKVIIDEDECHVITTYLDIHLEPE